jgi:lysophospholipid acyltransferase (LPLAT)-like uncharacterized protein
MKSRGRPAGGGGVIERLLPAVIAAALRVLSWTWRVEFADAEDLFACWQRGERAIIAFWHDRLLMMPVAARGQRVCVLVSQHRDGEIAARVLRRWGIEVVRGSATRGGARGFLDMVEAHRAGFNIAILPDGPRGPRHVVKAGVVYLARATGAPIFPVSATARPAARLRSWDRMIVPLPFARVVLCAGEPLAIPAGTGREELEVHRRALEERLSDVTRSVEVSS